MQTCGNNTLKSAYKMDQETGMPFDLSKEKDRIIKEREKKWDTFFKRYDGMDEVNSDEELPDSDYDEEITNQSAEDVIDVEGSEYEFEDEDEEDSDICIEVSDDDDDDDEKDEDIGAPFTEQDFEKAYKEVAQQTIQTFERLREEHTSEEIKTKGMTKSIRKSIIEKKAAAISKTTAPKSNTSMLLSKTLADIDNSLGVTNDGPLHMDLMQQSASPSLVEEHHFTDGDIVYVQQIHHIVTTTTTTTTRVIKKSGIEEDNCSIDESSPKKGTSSKLPKSSKKMRQSAEFEEKSFDYADNYSGSTPHTDRRKTRFTTPNNPSTRRNLLAIANTPHRIVVTPTTAKNPKQLNSSNPDSKSQVTVRKNQIRKQLNEELGENELSKKDRQKVERNIRVAKDDILAVVVCPEQTTNASDFLAEFKSRRSTLVVKEH